jgi:hypothetical protein
MNTGTAGETPFRLEEGVEIPIERVRKDPAEQVSHGFDRRVWLMASILRTGARLPPVRLEEAPDGTYHLLDGSRRVTAAWVAGRPTVLADVFVPAHRTAGNSTASFGSGAAPGPTIQLSSGSMAFPIDGNHRLRAIRAALDAADEQQAEGGGDMLGQEE